MHAPAHTCCAALCWWQADRSCCVCCGQAGAVNKVFVDCEQGRNGHRANAPRDRSTSSFTFRKACQRIHSFELLLVLCYTYSQHTLTPLSVSHTDTLKEEKRSLKGKLQGFRTHLCSLRLITTNVNFKTFPCTKQKSR